MKCENARKCWNRRLDEGESDAELDEHLASCESCRRYAVDMLRLVGLFEELREDTESLTPAVPQSGSLVTPRSRREWAMQTRSLLRIAATLVIVVGAGLWFRTPNELMLENPTSEAAAPAMQGITLRAESLERFIAVAVPSAEPNVQTFWLYPSVTVTESQDRS